MYKLFAVDKLNISPNVYKGRTCTLGLNEVTRTATQDIKVTSPLMHENRLRNIVSINEEQFGFVKGKSTTCAIFALRQLQERYRGQQD